MLRPTTSKWTFLNLKLNYNNEKVKHYWSATYVFNIATFFGRDFQVMGMTVEDYIHHAKAEHSSEVNEEKQMKKDIKKQQLYHETMYGASSAPLTPINQVPAQKRQD